MPIAGYRVSAGSPLSMVPTFPSAAASLSDLTLVIRGETGAQRSVSAIGRWPPQLRSRHCRNWRRVAALMQSYLSTGWSGRHAEDAYLEAATERCRKSSRFRQTASARSGCGASRVDRRSGIGSRSAGNRFPEIQAPRLPQLHRQQRQALSSAYSAVYSFRSALSLVGPFPQGTVQLSLGGRSWAAVGVSASRHHYKVKCVPGAGAFLAQNDGVLEYRLLLSRAAGQRLSAGRTYHLRQMTRYQRRSSGTPWAMKHSRLTRQAMNQTVIVHIVVPPLAAHGYHRLSRGGGEDMTRPT